MSALDVAVTAVFYTCAAVGAVVIALFIIGLAADLADRVADPDSRYIAVGADTIRLDPSTEPPTVTFITPTDDGDGDVTVDDHPPTGWVDLEDWR